MLFDLGAGGVWVAVGQYRPAAGGAVAGVREAGAGEDGGDGGLGAAAGVAAAAAAPPGGRRRMQCVSFPVRAITLDLDDTLWPFAPIGERIERVLDAWMREQIGRAHV